MKLAALFAVLLAAAPVSAQNRTGEVSVSLSGGGAAPLGSAALRRSAGVGSDFGAAVRYGLSEHFDAALSYDSVNMRKARALRLEPFLLSLVHSYRLGGFWTPAWRIGAGPVLLHEARLKDTQAHSSFAVRTGVGSDYSLTPDLGLGAWADYLFVARSNSESREVHAATLNFSLTWRLSRLQARTAPQKPFRAPDAAPRRKLAAPKADTTPDAVQEPPLE